MRRWAMAFLTLALTAAWGGTVPVCAAAPWRVSLPDTLAVNGDKVLLRELSRTPVPAAAGDLVVHAGGVPNTVVSISRRKILRQLVSAGLGQGVAFAGAETSHLVFAGRELRGDVLAAEMRQQLQALVPADTPGAPNSWFDLEYPDLRFAAAGDWTLQLKRGNALEPGRNLVPVEIRAGSHRESFSASVVLHRYEETARAVRKIRKETPLSEALFTWEWRDQADLSQGIASGRGSLAGVSATRSIAPGDLLRAADLKNTPLILAGDPVELMVVRGQVAVTVRAFARQPGCLGQTIPVRNELTGRLVNARVAGPGLVEWRR